MKKNLLIIILIFFCLNLYSQDTEPQAFIFNEYKAIKGGPYRTNQASSFPVINKDYQEGGGIITNYEIFRKEKLCLLLSNQG